MVNARLNFIEVDTVDEANKIDLNFYIFLDKQSASRNKYCFKIREAVRNG